MKIKSIALSIAFLLSSSAFAYDIEEFKAKLVEKFPATAGSVVAPAFTGFYSVVKNNEVIYFRDDLSLLIAGDVIDLTSNVSLTAKIREANRPKVDLSSLNLKHSITFGNGSRKIFVFSDPDCPFCKKLESELTKLTDVTIHMFPFPIAQLHPNAKAISESIWCSGSPSKAWRDYVLKGIAPKALKCANPVDVNIATGEQLGVAGTPAIFFEDGSLIPGAVDAERIEAHLARIAEVKK